MRLALLDIQRHRSDNRCILTGLSFADWWQAALKRRLFDLRLMSRPVKSNWIRIELYRAEFCSGQSFELEFVGPAMV